jgi:hypothetical protein
MKDRRSPNDRPDETMEPPLNPRKPKGHAALGRDIQAKIGQQLRAYYDSLVEPTPDKFADLLRQLEKPGKGTAEEGNG